DGRIIRTPRTEFKAALLNVAGAGGGINNRRLGIWLAQSEGKIVNGMRLLPRGHRQGSKAWGLEKRGGVLWVLWGCFSHPLGTVICFFGRLFVIDDSFRVVTETTPPNPPNPHPESGQIFPRGQSPGGPIVLPFKKFSRRERPQPRPAQPDESSLNPSDTNPA